MKYISPYEFIVKKNLTKDNDLIIPFSGSAFTCSFIHKYLFITNKSLTLWSFWINGIVLELKLGLIFEGVKMNKKLELQK